jgi:hypothetical protein
MIEFIDDNTKIEYEVDLIDDTGLEFLKFLDRVRKNDSNTVVIFGTEDGIKNVSQFQFNAMYGKYITFGLHDVFERFVPHYLLYFDEVINNRLAQGYIGRGIWIRKNGDNHIILPVLKFCQLAGIEKIVLCGLDFDNIKKTGKNGMLVHKQISSALRLLFNENNCEIIYTDESNFLNSLEFARKERLNWV